jgi:VWFA-related protein
MPTDVPANAGDNRILESIRRHGGQLMSRTTRDATRHRASNSGPDLLDHRAPAGPLVALLAVVAIFTLATPSVTPQVPDGRSIRGFFEPIDVNLVNLDVTVTDLEGLPVRGLDITDFKVEEDGVPVEITHFFAAPMVAGTPPNPETDVVPADHPFQNLYFVIFFDEVDLAPFSRRAAIDQLHNFLNRDLPAGLRLMLVTYDGRMRIRVPFTGDASQLVSAIEELGREKGPGIDRERERILRSVQTTAAEMATAEETEVFSQGLARDGSDGAPQPSGSESDKFVRVSMLTDQARAQVGTIQAYADRRRQRTERLLRQLGLLVRTLSAAPGPKAVLFVCDGLEIRPGERLFAAWEHAFPAIARDMYLRSHEEAQKYDVGDGVQSLVQQANGRRTSFFTLSSERRVASGISAEGGGVEAGGALFQAMADEEVLHRFAHDTGGQALLLSTGINERLGEVWRGLTASYSLGYRPEHSGDGIYHSLSVRVQRPGVQVRHRDGYLDTSSADRVVDSVFAAAILGVIDNPLEVSVEATRSEHPTAKGAYPVPLLVRIPMDRLVLVPRESEHEGQVSVMAAVYGTDGLSDVQTWSFPIEIANEQLMNILGQNAGFEIVVTVREGTQRIGIGVRDEVAKTAATTVLEMTASAIPPGEEGNDGP